MQKLLLFLILFGQLPREVEDNLRNNVTSHWDALKRGDVFSALQFVAADSRNSFLKLKHPAVQQWQLEAVEPLDGARILVTLRVIQFLEGARRFYPVERKQVWVEEEGNWRLTVSNPDSQEVRKALLGGGSKPQELPKRLSVLPEVLKLHFLNPIQRGGIVIRNGLDTPVDVVGLELDETKFRIDQKPVVVEPGQVGKIFIRYLGSEEEKDLTSPLRLTLSQGGTVKNFEITILYNHISAESRAFFGLTEEEAKALKKGQVLKPKVQLPSGVEKPAPGLSPEVPKPPEQPPSGEIRSEGADR